MTKSTITRERIQRIIRAINSEAYDEEEIREWLSSDEIMELSRMALAAMDSSESVEMPLDYLHGHKDGLEWAAQLAEANHPETGDWLYDDPIELAKAIRKGPDMPPAQPAPVEVKGSNELYDVIDGDDNVVLSAVSYNEAQTESDGYNGEDLCIVRHEAQPAPVVPDEKDKTVDADDHPLLWSFNEGWNACRAAMLQAGNSPAQSDCCPAQNHVSPEQNGDTPAKNQGWIPVSERMPESNGVYFGWDGKRVLEVNCFFGGFSANQFIHGEITHWMPLPAAPQEVNHG